MIEGLYFRSGAAQNSAKSSVVQPAAKSSSSRASRSRVSTFAPPSSLVNRGFSVRPIVPTSGPRVDYLRRKAANGLASVANRKARG
jgi:hypothetical protein